LVIAKNRPNFYRMKKTLIIGASTNPERYAYKAAHSLTAHGHTIVQLGIKEGQVANEPIHTNKPILDNIDTVTLYIGPKNQPEWYDYIIDLKPKRVIFNPGTENIAFENLLTQNKIETLEACTLVMLSIGNY
jgi:uncharacterized protein